MLNAFGFETIAVLIGDTYFLDPEQKAGQEGAEHGVRVELRLVDRGEPHGSVYAGVPIGFGRPVWRVDLFGTVDSPTGTLNRAHHHPDFVDWEPNGRTFEPELSAHPLGWLAGQLEDPAALFARVGIPADVVTKADEEGLAAAVPEIVAAVGRMLQGVWEGELAPAPADPVGGARVGWL